MEKIKNRFRFHDNDRLVCYKPRINDSDFTDRFKLNIKKHGQLSERKEERNFGYPHQVVYSVNGKVVYDGSFNPTFGNVIVAKQKGARMGLYAIAVCSNDSCRPYQVDCTSNESTPTPNTWNCFARNEFDDFFESVQLIKVDENQDPLCGKFELQSPDSQKVKDWKEKNCGLFRNRPCTSYGK